VKVLVACESSGVVREKFIDAGHDAWSCDLLPSDDGSIFHIIGDVLGILGDGWDLMVCHPPCTYLCSSGMHWTTRGLRDPELTKRAISFAKALWFAPIPKICMENPVGVLSHEIGRPAQYIQPYEFGEDASKKTGLWLKGLPPLTPTRYVPPRMVNGRPRWSNQTDSGQNRLGPSSDRWKLRSQTFNGIAAAMAEQWG
jgi:hypothetical protein